MKTLYITTRYLILLCCTLTLVGCASVDFEPYRKHAALEQPYRLPSMEGYKPIGNMYIGGGSSDSKKAKKDPWSIELTRKRAKYQASTPIYEGTGKRSNLLLSVNRGTELKTGLNFSFDFDLFK